LAQFQSVLSKGTPEAKLYALCGIRALNPSGFKAAASALIKANPQVEIIGGCCVNTKPAAIVAKQIGSGVYDRHFHTTPPRKKIKKSFFGRIFPFIKK
jgi:hypothetical protein